MKTVKDLLNKATSLDEAYGVDHLSKADIKGRPMGFTRGDTDAPAVLILKRKAIRIYPDNQKVALYYAQQLDKYISVPFGGRTKEIAGTISEAWFKDDELDPKTISAVQKQFQQQKNRQKAVSDIAAQSSDWQAAKHKETYQAKKAQNVKGTGAYRAGRALRLGLMRLAAKATGRQSPLTKSISEPEVDTPPTSPKTTTPKTAKPQGGRIGRAKIDPATAEKLEQRQKQRERGK